MGIEKYRGWPRLKWRCQDGAEALGMGTGGECGVKGGGPTRSGDWSEGMREEASQEWFLAFRLRQVDAGWRWPG